MRESRNKPPARRHQADIAIDGHLVPLTIRHHPRARRVTLKIAVPGPGALITLPPGVSAAEGLTMARSQSAWLKDRLARQPAPVPFADGAVIPFRGIPRHLRHLPDQPVSVWLAIGAIEGGGAPGDFAGLIARFLERQALAAITERAIDLAGRLTVEIGRIRLGDPVSRWASCSTSGNLSFSWRLILAPTDVLEYVVAHEVAHRIEPNHGPRFHRLVASLVPDAASPRVWLRRHGPGLHRYG